MSNTANISNQTSTGRALRILIAAGGTGGHVFPAISIADAIREQAPEAEIAFVGTRERIEERAVPEAGYPIHFIWISGLHRRLTLKNLLFPVKLLVSLMQSRKIIRDLKPQVVVSCGGYVAGPVGWTAARKRIPLVIQEQNSFPGVTNRMLGKSAQRIFTAFDEAKDHFAADKVKLAGNPTRGRLRKADRRQAFEAFSFDPGKPVLLVLGGSGGARSINEAMAACVKELHDEQELQVIWQCGKRYEEKLTEEIQPQQYPNLRLTAFIDRMDLAYAAADLVVSRAGAGSIAELQLTGCPSVLVPSPNVAGNHQHKNAQSMVRSGASILVEDDEAKGKLGTTVSQTITNEQKLADMKQAALKLARPEAAKTIATEILNLTKAQEN